MRRLALFFRDLPDRLYPLFALCGFVGSLAWFAQSVDCAEHFRSGCALVLSTVAMWAFWFEPGGSVPRKG